jgi:hypothetical protein
MLQSTHPCVFCGSMHSTIDALPQKVPKQKSCQTPWKMGDQWLSFIKLYYSKKIWNFVFDYNTNDLRQQKAYKKPHIRLLNNFLLLQIVFELLLF